MDKGKLIEHMIKEGELKSIAVEKAFMNVERGNFIPDDQKLMTYFDVPLSISCGQTISAPSAIAKMLELAELKKGLKVLEIGTGSGYNTALICEIIGEENVTTIERYPDLAKFAKENLRKNGYSKIEIICGDGSLGFPDNAPYDRIISTAASPQIPFTWIDQIKNMGLIIAPIGGHHLYQELMTARKSSNGKINKLSHGSCVFVPLIGDLGFPEYSENLHPKGSGEEKIEDKDK